MVTPRRVLLVEDNEDNRAIYATLLRHVGYDVLEAVNGDEALAGVIAYAPDIVLLDIALPTLDGWAVARTLRATPATAHIPLVAVTAHAFETDRAYAQQAGFAAFLAKPIEPRDVVKCVELLIGPPHAQRVEEQATGQEIGLRVEDLPAA